MDDAKNPPKIGPIDAPVYIALCIIPILNGTLSSGIIVLIKERDADTVPAKDACKNL